MLAVDTNILVRYLAGDDASQHEKVLRLFESQPIFVPVTVLLEIEWVLRAVYRLPSDEIMRGFQALAGVARVTLQSRQNVLHAIAWCLKGLDFADAMHLATAEGATRMLTFDRGFVGRSKGLGPIAVTLL